MSAGRDRHLHVREPQARHDRRRRRTPCPNDPQDFSSPPAAACRRPASQLDDDADPTLSNTRTFANVVPGSGYSSAETVPARLGPDQRHLQRRQPGLQHRRQPPARPSPARSRTQARAGSSSSKDARPERPAGLRPSRPAAGSRPRASRSTTTPTGRSPNTQTFSDVLAGDRLLGRRDRAAGWDQTERHLRRRQPGRPTSTSRPARPSPAPSRTASAGRSSWSRTAVPDDPQDFSLHGRRRALSPRASRSTTTPTRRSPTRRTFTNVAGRLRLLARRDRARRLGPRERHLRRRQPASRTSTSPPARPSPARSRTASAARSWSSKDATPNDPQDFSFTAGGGLSPASFSLDDDSDRDALQHAHVRERRTGQRLLALRDACPAAGTRPSATCDDGSPVSNIDVAPGETVTCTFTNRKRGQIVVVEGLACPTTRRTSPSPPAAGSRRPASRSTTTRPGRSPNTRTFANVVAGQRLLARRDRARRLGPDQRPPATTAARSRTSTWPPGETVTCTFTNTQARHDRRRRGRRPERPPGLLLHGRRRPLARELLASTTTRTRRCRTRARSQRRARVAATRSRRPSRRLGPRRAPRATTAARCRTSRRRRRDRHLHVRTTASAARSWSSRTRCPTTRRTSPSRPAAASRPTSFSLDDDSDRTLPNTRTFATSRPARATRSPRPCRPAGTRPRATCDDGSPLSNIDVAAGETVTCTFTNRKRGRSWSSRTRSPNDPQDFAFTAGGGSQPASFQLDDDSDGTLSNTRTFANVVAADGYSLAESRARPAGTSTAATCDDGSPVSNIDVGAGRDRHLHVPEHASAARSWWSKDATAERSAGLRLHGRRRPVARRASSSTTTPTGRSSNTRTFDDVVPGGGYSLAESVPSGWDQTSATCDDGSPVVEHRRQRRRGRHLHVLQPQARQDRGGQGRDPRRPAGLLLHGRRRPVAGELPARRRLRPDAVEHAHLRERRAGQRLLARRDRAERLDPGERRLQRRQRHIEHRRVGGRDGHLHVREHARISAAARCNAASRLAGHRLRELRCAEPHTRPAAGTPPATLRRSRRPPDRRHTRRKLARVEHGRQRAARRAAGHSGTPADEADVAIEAKVTDVRRRRD